MGVGVSSSGSKARSSGNDVKRRYYTNPTNLSTGRPAKSTQYNWGLGGRNNYSQILPVELEVITILDLAHHHLVDLTVHLVIQVQLIQDLQPPTMNTSSSTRGSSSVGSSGRGSRQ